MATAPVIDRNGSSSRRPRSAGSDNAVVSSVVAPVAWVPVLLVVLGIVALHAVCIMRYGYFRDELYYISCAKRFDWGFVDQPPLSVLLLKLVAGPFGYPLWLVRAPAILCGAGAALIAALVTRDLGGKKLAQTLAATMVAVAGTYLVVTHLYSMNSLDVLFWALAAWIWAGIGKPQKTWLWLAMGALMGVAMLNKLSGLWLL
ncbi:MAG: glycosyltransferase family 39 protein, partial [Armatimonadota bacterium]